MDKRNRTKISNGSGVHSLPSTSTRMTPSTSSVAPSTPIPKSEIYASLLSTSRMAPPAAEMTPSTSNKLALSTSLMTPSTPIPTKFIEPPSPCFKISWINVRELKLVMSQERIHDTSTPEERMEFLDWARSTAEKADPDECTKLLEWAYCTAEIAAATPEEGKDYLKWAHSKSTMASSVVRKRRFLKWAHFTSKMQRKSWSLQEEISKPFETALKLFQEEINQNEMALKYGCSDLKEEHMIYTCDKGKHGVYQCQNGLWIWPKLRNSRAIPSFQSDGGLKGVGKKLKENFPESAMIKGRPTVNRLGFVTIKLSGKWIAKAPECILEELILEKDEGWEKAEERILGFHLLEFTEALEESCLSVLPHILCEYLCDLSKKFNSYYSSVQEVGSVGETSTLLLCEATAIVMEKCFHLLGITPTSSFEEGPPLGLPMDMGSSVFGLQRTRCPSKNSRLEVFSFSTAAIKQINPVPSGEVFGLISVADKYGLLSSDQGLHFFEPEVAHVPLFYHDWCNPVKMIDWGLIYLGNPGSSHSVPFTSSIEFRMELYVTKKKNASYQLCNHKIELDLSNFWGEKSDSACGVLTVEGEDGPTYMFYVLLKDAVDAALEIRFETACDRRVHGYVVAFYGDDFFYECECLPSDKDGYMALLFLPNTSSVLTNCIIPLIRSVLAVPTKGSLIIKAYLEDESGEVIMNDTCKFKSQLEGCSSNTIRGTDCSLEVKVDWKFQAQYRDGLAQKKDLVATVMSADVRFQGHRSHISLKILSM
ncbi:arginyl-tRNA synthetase, class Ic [Artemisia annua]|uniref:arginine--tRNA ligase n=1 Tax=Artemisia annua TaxID=35608 RepID=A0A2U1LYT8_ARTAN|nr:arginyl-tRNA synthetase, class Ic [Artemisia annua]